MKTFRMIGMALVAILMSVSLVSCSSDDEEEPVKLSYAEMIVGRWITDWNDIYTFNKDGSLSWSDVKMEFRSEGTWSVAGNILTISRVASGGIMDGYVYTRKHTI